MHRMALGIIAVVAWASLTAEALDLPWSVWGQGNVVTILPDNPTSAEEIRFAVAGVWPMSCLPTWIDPVIEGTDLYYNLMDDSLFVGICNTVPTIYSDSPTFRVQLPAGTYNIYASWYRGDPGVGDYYVQQGPDLVGTLIVAPAQPQLAADVDNDCEVSVLDIVQVVTQFGYTPEDPNWNARCDLDGDGEISVLDIVSVVTAFGQTCEDPQP